MASGRRLAMPTIAIFGGILFFLAFLLASYLLGGHPE